VLREHRSEACTPRDLVVACGFDEGTLVLDWPTVATASCRACGKDWEPMLRRARFRGIRCVACGSADVVEETVLTSIAPASEWSTRFLADLGQPSAHVHEIASATGERVFVELGGDFPEWVREPAPC
jgi:hypothetical protein